MLGSPLGEALKYFSDFLPERDAGTGQLSPQRAQVAQVSVMLAAPFALARTIGIEDHVGAAAMADRDGGLERLTCTHGWGVQPMRADELMADAGRVTMIDQDIRFVRALGPHDQFIGTVSTCDTRPCASRTTRLGALMLCKAPRMAC